MASKQQNAPIPTPASEGTPDALPPSAGGPYGRGPRSRRNGQRIVSARERAAIQATFLAAFRERGIVRAAAEVAGVGRALVYAWRRSDPDFAAAWAEAEEDANDVIRREIHRRAVDGWDEVTTTTTTDADGNVRVEVRQVRRHSDAVLRMLAQARMPEYRDRVDVTTGDKALDYARIIADPASAELAARLAEAAGVHAGGAGAGRD